MQQHIHALELKSVNVLFGGDQEIGEYAIEQIREGFKDEYNVAGVLTRSCSTKEIQLTAHILNSRTLLKRPEHCQRAIAAGSQLRHTLTQSVTIHQMGWCDGYVEQNGASEIQVFENLISGG